MKSNLKDKLSKNCYSVKIELNQEEAELNRRKIQRLRELEDQLRHKIDDKKRKQQEIMLNSFYAARSRSISPYMSIIEDNSHNMLRNNNKTVIEEKVSSTIDKVQAKVIMQHKA